MKIDGLFIEYLISGGVAYLWIIPLASILKVDPTVFSYDAELILLAIPVTYILGMLIDYLAASILTRYKAKARTKWFELHGLKSMSFYDALIEISNSNNTLIKHLEMRESRVRAARGALINLLFVALIIPIYVWINKTAGIGLLTFLFLGILVFISWRIYQKMIRATYTFQAKVVKRLRMGK